MNLLIAVVIIAQISLPTASYPELSSPTPWVTPTPAPTLAIQDLPADLMATVTAQADGVGLSTNGTQVYFDNRPLLPNINDANTVQSISYVKWLTSTGSQSVFGPFAPLLASLGLLIFINLVFSLVWIWQNFILTLLKAIWSVILFLIKLIRG